MTRRISSGAAGGITGSGIRTDAGTGRLDIRLQPTGTGKVYVDGEMSATSISETSSITLKENVTPIDNALDVVLKLSGVTYDRTDTHEHEAGLIAEWVDEVVPHLVTRRATGEIEGIKYTKLVAYLIESIKTLNKEIEDIKSRN